ncbi:hypothetical protein RD792_006530, partial [Penstemon davidsonii]
VFDGLPFRNIVSWTAIITGLVRAGFNSQGLMYFSNMWRDGFEYDSYMFVIALKACADMELLKYGKEIHARTMKKGLAHSLAVANSLMTMYSKCGLYDLASIIFHELTRREIISGSSIIAGYAQGGAGEEAFELLSWMRREGPKPTEFALSSVFGSMAILDQGRQLHAFKKLWYEVLSACSHIC